MSLNKEKQTAEDQYLDLIIKLAFERKAELEIEQLLNEPDPVLTDEEKAAADKMFQTVLAEDDEQRRKEKKTQSILFFRNAMLNVCKVAACLIIVAGIAVPIAIATSSQFRSKVMQLLMDIDTVNNEAHFSFVEDEDAAFYVPTEWEGEWYLSFIPDDLSVRNIYNSMLIAEFDNGDIRQLWFHEMDSYDDIMVGTENAKIEITTINGNPGWMIVGNKEYQSVVIIWKCDEKWFQVNSLNLSESEMKRIAEGVKKIILK